MKIYCFKHKEYKTLIIVMAVSENIAREKISSKTNIENWELENYIEEDEINWIYKDDYHSTIKQKLY